MRFISTRGIDKSIVIEWTDSNNRLCHATLSLPQEAAQGDEFVLGAGSGDFECDDKSTELNQENKIQIKNFESGYWHYNASIEGKYEYIPNQFKDGLQPQVVSVNGNFEIQWFEPNPTTIEGVEAELAQIQTKLNRYQQKLDTIEEGAQVNKIESITLNGIDITPVDKEINININLLNGGSASE